MQGEEDEGRREVKGRKGWRRKMVGQMDTEIYREGRSEVSGRKGWRKGSGWTDGYRDTEREGGRLKDD